MTSIWKARWGAALLIPSAVVLIMMQLQPWSNTMRVVLGAATGVIGSLGLRCYGWLCILEDRARRQ